MLGPVVCRACGAKVREDRTHCLRCGASLAVPSPAGTTGPAESSRRLLAASGAAVVVLGLGLAVFSRPSAQPAVIQAETARADAPPPAEASASAPTAPSPAVVSMDVSRAGIAAYARGDITGAIEQFTAAVAANPENPDALNNLGQVLVRDGRAREAIPYFDRAIALVATTWAYHFNRARAFAILEEWTPAIAGYREAVRLFPDDYVTAFNLARALHQSGDINGAIGEYERAISLAPGEPDFHLSHAHALEQAQRPTDAVAAYRRYLELQDGTPTAEKIKARIAQLEAAPPPAAPVATVQ